MAKRRLIFPVILSAILAVPLLTISKEKASARVETRGGLRTVIFEDSSGKIFVHFPDDISAGSVFSGAVIAEPEGDNEQKRKKNRARLEGRVVEVEKQQARVKEQGALWSLPADLASGFATVILKDQKGKEIGRTQVPCFRPGYEPELQHPDEKSFRPQALREKISFPGKVALPEPDDYLLPRFGQTGEPGVVRGRFDGKFSTTSLTLENRELKLLAESPRKLVFECPYDVIGAAEMRLKERDVEASGSFTNVGIELSAPKTHIRKLESMVMDLKAKGLRYVNQPIPLQLRKAGPITLEGGDEQAIVIWPENVSQDGTFELKRTITGNQTGSFGVEATLTVPEIKIWLLTPEHDAEVAENRPLFQWSVSPKVRNITYALKICEVLPGQSFSEATENFPFFLAREIGERQLQYPPDASPPENGKRYVFLVKGLDKGTLIAKSGLVGFWFTGPAGAEKDPCEELRREIEKLEKELKDKEDEQQKIPQDKADTQSELSKCEAELAKAKKDRDKAKSELQVKKNLKDNAEKYDRPDKEQRKKDYEEAQKRLEEAEKKVRDLENKSEELGKKLEGLKEREEKLPGEIEDLKKKLEELKEKLRECEEKEREKTRAEKEKKEREEQEERERDEAARREEEAREQQIEHVKYLLRNIQALGLISSPGFWEAPGLWDWLPEALRTPLGALAEDFGKVPIPTDTLPALAGIYQIAGALLDPCTPDGKRKTVERLMNRINSKTGSKYTLEEALDKVDDMCDLLTKLKKLAELAQKKK
ncbi:MAG: hypothetical protein AB1715_07255 [Acidobacteriota bacterium]